MVDDWAIKLKGRGGEPLSASARTKVIVALKKIMDDAVYHDYLVQNPIKGIPTFRDTSPEREIFTREEIEQLFPHDYDELLRIWQSRIWIAFYMVFAFTGRCPGEVSALKPNVWYRDIGVLIIKNSIDTHTQEMIPIKTSKRGVKKIRAVLPDRANEQLLLLETELGLQPDDLFFTMNGRPLIAETSNKHFKYSCRRAGIDLKGRTQYSLRHSFKTHIAMYSTLSQAQEAMGHVTKSMFNHYFHPSDEALALKESGRLPERRTFQDAVEYVFG